jgi:hypothetical protein
MLYQASTGRKRGGSQVGDHAPADRGFTVAHAAKPIEQGFSGSHGRRVGDGGRRIRKERQLGRKRRQSDFAAELVHEHATEIARVAGLVRILALHQGISAAPAG